MATETPPPDQRSYEHVRDGLTMPLEDAMLTQRAVRRVLPDPVDDEIVLRCIELALKAPTGSNGQNWEFLVVKDAETKASLQRLYKQAWTLYGGVGRFLQRGDESQRKIMDAVQWQVDHFDEYPVLVVPCLRGGKIPGLPSPAIAESSYYGSIYPSVQNLLLAARAMGLGASLITLPLWNQPSVNRLLGLPLAVQAACVVPMGWPRGRYGPTTRKPVGEVVHLDRYGEQPWADGGA